MTDMKELSAHEIGRRLRVARENANKLPAEAAAVIGMSHPTIVSIEKGERKVRVDKLQMLARFNGLSLNALMRREAVHVNLIPRFRRLKETQSKGIAEAAKLLNILVRAEVELENILGIQRSTQHPEERAINVGDVKSLADQHAMDLRKKLDIGSGPIADIFYLIEFKMGVRLFQRNLASSISGLFVYDESVGACILLNSKHSYRRRVYSAAHELGHFIGTRYSSETFENSEKFSSREERYADFFAQTFLSPKDSITSVFREVTAGSTKITRKHIILIARQFGVSREFCVRRLEELDLVRKGTWDWFQENGGLTKQHEKDVLGDFEEKHDQAKLEAKQPLLNKLGLMATRAWEQGLLSEGQLSELLGIHRVPLRKIFYENLSEEGNSDDILKFSVR